jgi:hypothetical protein
VSEVGALSPHRLARPHSIRGKRPGPSAPSVRPGSFRACSDLKHDHQHSDTLACQLLHHHKPAQQASDSPTGTQLVLPGALLGHGRVPHSTPEFRMSFEPEPRKAWIDLWFATRRLSCSSASCRNRARLPRWTGYMIDGESHKVSAAASTSCQRLPFTRPFFLLHLVFFRLGSAFVFGACVDI